MDKPKSVEEYIDRHRRAVQANPGCGTSHYNLAVGLIGQRRLSEAEEELHQAIECSPTLAEAYAQLGGICMFRGDLEGCLNYNRMAVKARPGFSEGWGNIGYVHLQKGEAEEAIKALEKATYFNFRYVQAFANLAAAHLMKGDPDKSIEFAEKALGIDDGFAPAHNNLAIAYIEKGDWAKAAEHCDKALASGYEVAEEIRSEIEANRTDAQSAGR